MGQRRREIFFGKPWPDIDPVALSNGIASALYDGYQIETKAYLRRPGKTLWDTLPVSYAVDGLYEGRYHASQAGKLFGVANGRVYRRNSAGNWTAFTGTAFNVGSPCYWGEYDDFCYLATGQSPLQKLDLGNCTQASLGGNAPTGCTHLSQYGNYLIVNDLSAGYVLGDVAYSDDRDNDYGLADSWELINAEMIPDACNGVFVDFERMFATGPYSVESNVLTTDVDNPWERYPGGFWSYGVVAPHTVVKINNTYFWLTLVDKVFAIAMVAGDMPLALSTPYSKMIAACSLTNAKAWGISYNGYPFYVISFPSNNLTLAYNIRMKHWAIWSYMNGANRETDLINSALMFQTERKMLVGDRQANGRIYDVGGLTDNGIKIKFEAISGPDDGGTPFEKEVDRYDYCLKRGQATDASTPTFKHAYNSDGAGWEADEDIEMGLVGDEYYYTESMTGGRYRRRQHRILCESTVTDFEFVNLFETAHLARK